MADDLDLALRIRADGSAAQASLRQLRANVNEASANVIRANNQSAQATARASAAAQQLQRAQQAAAQQNTAAARAAVIQAQAENQAAQAAQRDARAQLQAAQAKQRSARASQQLAQSLNAQNTAQNRVAGSSRNAGLAVQNTAYQVGDFAVQVASGQNAMVAMAQQLPQLLGGFGILGAVLGGLVAVGAALSRLFWDWESGADDVTSATERLADANAALDEFTETRRNIKAMADLYGEATARAYGLHAARTDLATQDATLAATQQISEVGDLLGTNDLASLRKRKKIAADQATQGDLGRGKYNSGLEELIGIGRKLDDEIIRGLELGLPVNGRSAREILEELYSEGDPKRIFDQVLTEFNDDRDELLNSISLILQQSSESEERLVVHATEVHNTALEETSKKIRQDFGLTVAAARDVEEAFAALTAAKGPDQQAQAWAGLREALTATGAVINNQTDEQQQNLTALKNTVFESEKGALGLANAGTDVAGQLQEAADAAADLKSELDNATEAMSRLQSRASIRLERAQINLDHADDPEERRRRLRLLYQREQTEDTAKRLQKSGVSDDVIAAELAPLRARAGAVFDSEAEADKATKTLREMERTGKSAASGIAREMRNLEKAQAKAREEAEKLKSALGDALKNYATDAQETRDDIADAWTSAFEGLEDVLVSFTTTGKLSFSDLANSILADLARIAIRASITGPLAEVFGGLFGAAPGSGAPASSPRPRLRPTTFHSGGVAVGPGAPGLAANEVVAVLERGEAVLTGRQSRALLGLERGWRDRENALDILRRAARHHSGGVAGLPGGAGATATSGSGNGSGGGAMGISVNIINRGTPRAADRAEGRFDPGGYVVDLFLQDLQRGGPMARGIQRVTGAKL